MEPRTSADAASQPVGSSPCYVVNLGLQGGMARDQDEPPIGLLLGSGPSQRALVDCDPDTVHGQVADEIRDGCQWPPYRGNAFGDRPARAAGAPTATIRRARSSTSRSPHRSTTGSRRSTAC